VAALLLRTLGRLRGLALRRGAQRVGRGGRLGAAGGQRGPRVRRSRARVRGLCLQRRAARLELHDLGFRLRPAHARQRLLSCVQTSMGGSICVLRTHVLA